jgi:chromate transporter
VTVDQPVPAEDVERQARLREVVRLFLKLGFVAFGGPAAHIAMMRDEAVVRRRWLSEQQFLDLLGASNLIPGPTSTELAIYLGYVRAGPWGLAAAGLCFILPAMCIVLALAWAYVRYGGTPAASWLLYGIKPVIIGIVVYALWGLGRTAVKDGPLGVIAAFSLALYLAGVSPIAVLLAGALAIAAVRRVVPISGSGVLALVSGSRLLVQAAGSSDPHRLGVLFLTFLKIGLVLYGSGYVLLAFLHSDFVGGLHWLTDRQIVDAVAVGQVTPGPVFTTATFIGYVVAGFPGAILATVATFLPSFALVAAVYRVLPRLRSSPLVRVALDGVNVASLGLMAGVTLQLARAAMVDPLTVILAGASLLLIARFRINSAWLIGAGAIIGVAFHALR